MPSLTRIDDQKLTDPHGPKPTSSDWNQRELVANFSLLTLYQVVLRIGWIFKTESIVMPAVLDLMGGSALLRGSLPMLNRFGQSIPPLLASDRMRQMPRKKYALSACSFVMGFCFLTLAIAWQLSGGNGNAWLPLIFLAIYGIFFVGVGLQNLAQSLLQGKLIPATARGRLMLFGTALGCGAAVVFAWFLMRGLLADESGQFAIIFMITGISFLITGGIALLLREPADEVSKTSKSMGEIMRGSLATLAIDRNFRLLAIIAGLFGMTITLFPHYQALGRQRLDVGLDALVPWIIAQNIGAAVFSIPLGWIADRFGNRLVLRMQMFLLCIAPILALSISVYGTTGGSSAFLFVFFLLGLWPVTMRTFNNYTLEIASRRQQPKYLGILSLCMAAPAVLTSSLVGAVVDWFGFDVGFIIVLACVVTAWVLTYRLKEPRTS